ncbi:MULTISPECIES: ATP-binding cassette domain-containing protein [Streptococcus]|jgi:ABC-type antimicrobial peptide transporter, ATPase component, putative|uniref:Macrolide export ATP-binding/permease protein MacB n=3 Tax=Streptococcus sanguinis TaxID=1305 RepID=A0A427ZD91_STRSA|nr:MULTISPECIES: ATP-binding cassette domain-containing protein [Streptococcus]EGJ37969.1 ABC superfamily ATP binding cassette transporter, ABC/membrane protein [Streptococcus sanguinis SK1056]KAF1306868.1 peptide ABC transporter ATPase [Streptococcus sanguinis OH0843]MBZ2041042.1 ATP-binding cassette domain-containing protein [Streptococcus sanguinis]MBZ2062384.1 ATP-binding cassette domain-containing protein [Streptococcus sanguinis]MBZ2064595.1 ATP-binding cassette domain-containing protein
MTIEIVNVTKKYGSKEIFTDLNLTFEAGKSYALIGGSGSGKSTLLNIIGRLEKIDSGKVLVDKQDIWKTKERTYFKNTIGYVFQNYSLIENKTVYDNLKLLNKDKKIISEILEKVGLSTDYLKHKIYELSGGQAQRVAIARMLMKPRKIILADEPTGALDSEIGNEIINLLLSEAAKNNYVIIATHDPAVYSKVDVIVDIKDIGSQA